jgi:hypothetical protein
MQTWINFWSFIFWLSLICFTSNLNNFIRLLFFSEITWIILYCNILFQGVINDDITLLSTSVYILGLAGLEYSIGILLLLIFKNINKNLEFNESNKNINSVNIFNNKNIYLNRYIWNY